MKMLKISPWPQACYSLQGKHSKTFEYVDARHHPFTVNTWGWIFFMARTIFDLDSTEISKSRRRDSSPSAPMGKCRTSQSTNSYMTLSGTSTRRTHHSDVSILKMSQSCEPLKIFSRVESIDRWASKRSSMDWKSAVKNEQENQSWIGSNPQQSKVLCWMVVTQCSSWILPGVNNTIWAGCHWSTLSSDSLGP